MKFNPSSPFREGAEIVLVPPLDHSGVVSFARRTGRLSGDTVRLPLYDEDCVNRRFRGIVA